MRRQPACGRTLAGCLNVLVPAAILGAGQLARRRAEAVVQIELTLRGVGAWDSTRVEHGASWEVLLPVPYQGAMRACPRRRSCHLSSPSSLLVLQEIKGEERAVCHFYRNSLPCQVRGRRRSWHMCCFCRAAAGATALVLGLMSAIAALRSVGRVCYRCQKT